MKLLIDTQIFIWWDSEPNKLPPRLLQLCEDEANTLVVSIASIWEIQIKAQLGKLDLNRPLEQIIHDQQHVRRRSQQGWPSFTENSNAESHTKP